MKALTIRGLPDEVHERLKVRAKKNRRSLNQEVIAELSSLGEGVPGRSGLLRDTVAEFRIGLKKTLNTEEIRAIINEDRV